ncbi:hypothetical protein [Estrella lausannensis]|uniref:Conserved putative membrane protein n=1 Tax=Estrella lausannensis TaxID=483423 RepID=A0A0H5DRC5_9BACT|nr:hypothetical protein [Estrella lausannensis]CRX38733.1 Conserved putative membrane protein [Estrella lausannensis]
MQEELSSENEGVKIYSSISPEYYRKKMFRGTAIALCGVLGIVYFGSFVKPENLHYIGLPVLFLGGLLIAVGLIPLRRLTKLDQNPDEVALTAKYFHYLQGGNPILTIPVRDIESIRFEETSARYGIAVTLKQKSGAEVIVHAARFNLQRFMERSRKRAKADLFFPYFARRSFSRLGFIPE